MRYRIIRRNRAEKGLPLDARYANEQDVRDLIKGYTKNADKDIEMLNKGSVIKTPKWHIKKSEDYDKFIKS